MSDFPDFARAHGLNAPQYLDDGRVHRCPTTRHPRSQNGAYRWEGSWGWAQDWSEHLEPVIWREEGHSGAIVARPVQQRVEDDQRAQRAAAEAARIIGKCDSGPHPYLARKGFPTALGLIDFDGRLVIPMRSAANYQQVQSLQWIASDGDKKFMTGGRARGAVFILGGQQSEKWLVEGYATALSVQAALAKLYRKACVVVCFSAGNLSYVAPRLTGRRFVIADNDESGTGEKVAIASGLPWVMPDVVGTDANDLYVNNGVFAVTKLLRKCMDTG